MTNKRVHSNWWYAEIQDKHQRFYQIYYTPLPNKTTVEEFWELVTEQELRDFWFEPVHDVYKECVKELGDIIAYLKYQDPERPQEKVKKILKKHFSKYVDTDD